MSAIEQATASWEPGPANPTLAEDEVHVWRADLDRPDWPPADDLPSDERTRAARLSGHTTDRWVASRWALRTVLARYLDEDPTAVQLRIGPHGKPALAEDPPRLHFNLSHSADLALIAVCRDHEVGVDIEHIRPRRNLLRLAERVLHPEAAAAVREALPEARLAVFHDAWTRHEATLKCSGFGIRSSQGVGVTSSSLVGVGPGYAAAMARPRPVEPSTGLFILPALSR